MDRIGDDEIKKCSHDKLFKRYCVCDAHFSEHCHLVGEKCLHRRSLPTHIHTT